MSLVCVHRGDDVEVQSTFKAAVTIDEEIRRYSRMTDIQLCKKQLRIWEEEQLETEKLRAVDKTASELETVARKQLEVQERLQRQTLAQMYRESSTEVRTHLAFMKELDDVRDMIDAELQAEAVVETAKARERTIYANQWQQREEEKKRRIQLDCAYEQHLAELRKMFNNSERAKQQWLESVELEYDLVAEMVDQAVGHVKKNFHEDQWAEDRRKRSEEAERQKMHELTIFSQAEMRLNRAEKEKILVRREAEQYLKELIAQGRFSQ